MELQVYILFSASPTYMYICLFKRSATRRGGIMGGEAERVLEKFSIFGSKHKICGLIWRQFFQITLQQKSYLK